MPGSQKAEITNIKLHICLFYIFYLLKKGIALKQYLFLIICLLLSANFTSRSICIQLRVQFANSEQFFLPLQAYALFYFVFTRLSVSYVFRRSGTLILLPLLFSLSPLRCRSLLPLWQFQFCPGFPLIRQ